MHHYKILFLFYEAEKSLKKLKQKYAKCSLFSVHHHCGHLNVRVTVWCDDAFQKFKNPSQKARIEKKMDARGPIFFLVSIMEIIAWNVVTSASHLKQQNGRACDTDNQLKMAEWTGITAGDKTRNGLTIVWDMAGPLRLVKRFTDRILNTFFVIMEIYMIIRPSCNLPNTSKSTFKQWTICKFHLLDLC